MTERFVTLSIHSLLPILTLFRSLKNVIARVRLSDLAIITLVRFAIHAVLNRRDGPKSFRVQGLFSVSLMLPQTLCSNDDVTH